MAATVTRSPLNQYSTSVTSGTTPADLLIRDVPDWTKMLRRQDTPFQRMIGRRGAPDLPMLKAEWGWGSPDPHTDAINENPFAQADVTLTVDNGAYFSVWDIIKIEAEILLVTAISGNNLTVTRGYAGTSDVQHADNTRIDIIAPALPENTDDPASPVTQGEVDFNYHQIMTFTWQLSQRAKVTPTYESRNFPGDRDKQELKKKMKFTAPLRLEKALLHGQRAQGTGGASSPSTMGGYQQSSYCTTTSDLGSNTVPLTLYDFNETLQTVWNLVGADLMPNTVMGSPFGKRIFNSWFDGARIYSGKDDTAKITWSEVETDFGRMKFVVNYLMSTVLDDEWWIFNPDDVALRPYASSTGWQSGMLATQGWYTKGYLRGDWTSIWQNPDARAKIVDFSITATDYPALA